MEMPYAYFSPACPNEKKIDKISVIYYKTFL